MPNTFSIHIDASDEFDVRLWIVIDGERRFQLGLEGLEDSIFAPDGPSDSILCSLRHSSSEQVVSYGFCVEDCCPSTFATVRVADQTVTWTGIRESTSNELLTAVEYEFERAQYDSEIKRVLVWLVGHYAQLYSQLKWPRAQSPEAEGTNAETRHT